MCWQYCKCLFYKEPPKHSCNMPMQLKCKENLYKNINNLHIILKTSASFSMMFTLKAAAQNLNTKTSQQNPHKISNLFITCLRKEEKQN